MRVHFNAPFDWPALLQFLSARAIDGVELIEGLIYRRTLRVSQNQREYVGWMQLELDGDALRLSISSSLSDATPRVLALVEHLIDAKCDPSLVASTLGTIASRHPGLRVPGAVDGFELAVRAILGQQITVKAARTLAGRFAASFGEPCDAPGLVCVFPRASYIARRRVSTLAKLGVLASRSQAIIFIARALVRGELQLVPDGDVQSNMRTLKSIPGVGEWTAQYIAMRAMGWRDAFPHSDLALLKAMGITSPAQALRQAEQWRPLRAYAVMHLWKSLESA